MAGLGGLLGSIGQQLGQARGSSPELFQAIGLGLLSGDLAGGFQIANKSQQERLARELQSSQFDRRLAQDDSQFGQRMAQDQAQFGANIGLQRDRMAQDQAQFGQSFGLQKEELGFRQGQLASEAQQRRAVQNATAEYLKSSGAPQNLVDLANNGAGAEAFRAWQTASAGDDGMREVQNREALADQYGLEAGSPERQAYVLTGKLPSAEKTVTAGDRQAIREADDIAFGAENAAQTLQTALGLSPNAYEGATAGARTWAGNNLPDWLVPDVIASPEGAATTARMDNAVTEGALQQMKSIFGGNPTEGERAILLEIQGSSKQPQRVREEIYKRALAAVERRRSFNADRAQELRGGSYYNPKGPSSASSSSGGLPDPLGIRR